MLDQSVSDTEVGSGKALVTKVRLNECGQTITRVSTSDHLLLRPSDTAPTLTLVNIDLQVGTVLRGTRDNKH